MIIKIIQINILIDKSIIKIIEFIKQNLQSILNKILKYLIKKKPKYYQMIIDKILELLLYLDCTAAGNMYSIMNFCG